MWLVTLFDLPVKTKKERKVASSFRKDLLQMGFTMMQLSVYMRFCESEERAATLRRKIRDKLPPSGEVRILTITDRQFAKMENFMGNSLAENEKRPKQLIFF
jgi:CRISPR-associated protein Cas2